MAAAVAVGIDTMIAGEVTTEVTQTAVLTPTATVATPTATVVIPIAAAATTRIVAILTEIVTTTGEIMTDEIETEITAVVAMTMIGIATGVMTEVASGQVRVHAFSGNGDGVN